MATCWLVVVSLIGVVVIHCGAEARTRTFDVCVCVVCEDLSSTNPGKRIVKVTGTNSFVHHVGFFPS